MSHYASVKTIFKDRECLIQALTETTARMGRQWTLEQIEVHDTPQHLYGFQGDQRQQTAEIIIRRQHVGGAANDIGFKKNADGTYEAVISDYDRSYYGEQWLGQLSQNYNVGVVTKQFKKQGMPVSVKKKQDGTIQVRALALR